MTTIIMAKAWDTIYEVHDSKQTGENRVGYYAQKVIRSGYGYIGGAGWGAIISHIHNMVSLNKDSFVNKTWEDTNVDELTEAVRAEILSYLEGFEQKFSGLVSYAKERPERDGGFTISYIDHYKHVFIKSSNLDHIIAGILTVEVYDITNDTKFISIGSGKEDVQEYIKNFPKKKRITKDNYEGMLWQAVKYASTQSEGTGFKIFLNKLTTPKLYSDFDYQMVNCIMNVMEPVTRYQSEEIEGHISLALMSSIHNEKMAKKYKESFVEVNNE